MSTVLVINLTSVTQHPRVVHADGTFDNVQIMPKRRVYLREGMTVCNNWLGLNPGTVKVMAPQEPASKAPSKGEAE